jgi:hypothetical protein
MKVNGIKYCSTFDDKYLHKVQLEITRIHVRQHLPTMVQLYILFNFNTALQLLHKKCSVLGWFVNYRGDIL